MAKYLLDGRRADLLPIGFTYQDYKDKAGLTLWSTKLRKVGFTTMGCIALAQAEIINQGCSPDEATVLRTRGIIKRFEEKRALGTTEFVHKARG
ncbi:hypothetical protein [Magnetococcus sp. PR-3]|uniref:hypothetical protein n=1 Tax=Magnetococcus sp. PR-3 TaxID=3120355 RepID=UPI002FCE451F